MRGGHAEHSALLAHPRRIIARLLLPQDPSAAAGLIGCDDVRIASLEQTVDAAVQRVTNAAPQGQGASAESRHGPVTRRDPWDVCVLTLLYLFLAFLRSEWWAFPAPPEAARRP